MASSVFFKFKSTREPIRVEFDGTGISVFELKREIIIKSGLGDGTDFDLIIAADEGMKEVYDDDTTIIPRSTTVIARRQPSKVAGRGGAARYVSGKMPVHAKNSSRREQAVKAATKGPSKAVAQMSSAMTEEEKLAAVFQAQTENWSTAQDELPQHQSTFKPGAKKPANVPDHEPPKGYVCYRCGESGHWIQLCPTNDNPEYDNRPRVKRTTGIPKSFLKTVDKATALGQNAEGDESKPSGIMVNADGEYVIAEPDKASWEQFQAKAKSNAAAQKIASQGDKEVQERGLECPIDQRMFIDPMKTPCCQKTYCNDCITNALIESDFVCPACKTEGVLIDDLKPDDEAAQKIKDFLAEREHKAKGGASTPKSPLAAQLLAAKAEAPVDTTTTNTRSQSKSKSPSTAPADPVKAPLATVPPTSTSASAAPATGNGAAPSADDTDASKKRPAGEPAENPRIPKAPKAMQQAQEVQQQQQQQAMLNQMMTNMPMGGMMAPMMPFPGMPMVNNFGGMGMPNMNMGMVNPMMNGMMGSGMGAGMGPGMGFPNMNGMGGMNGMNDMNGNFGGMNGMNGMNGMWGGDMNANANDGGNGPSMNNPMGGGMAGGSMNSVPNGNGPFNQQRPFKQFSHQPATDEDAYFRKPVNPHRHQNKQRRARPSDYREL